FLERCHKDLLAKHVLLDPPDDGIVHPLDETPRTVLANRVTSVPPPRTDVDLDLRFTDLAVRPVQRSPARGTPQQPREKVLPLGAAPPSPAAPLGGLRDPVLNLHP